MAKPGGKFNYKNNKGRQSKSSQKNGNGNKSKTSGKDYRFHPHGIGRQQQTCTFDTARDHCIQHIQSNYDYGTDMATALRNLKEFDFDSLRPARRQVMVDIKDESNEAEKQEAEVNRKFLQETADMEYRDEYTRFSKRKAKYAEN